MGEQSARGGTVTHSLALESHVQIVARDVPLLLFLLLGLLDHNLSLSLDQPRLVLLQLLDQCITAVAVSLLLHTVDDLDKQIENHVILARLFPIHQLFRILKVWHRRSQLTDRLGDEGGAVLLGQRNEGLDAAQEGLVHRILETIMVNLDATDLSLLVDISLFPSIGEHGLA